MIVAKMRTRHVPMKVLRLQIQSEHVGEQDIQRARKIPHGIRLQVAWRVERSGPRFGISNSNLHFLSPFVSLIYRTWWLATVPAQRRSAPLPRIIWRGGVSHHIADLILIRSRNASASMRPSAARSGSDAAWVPVRPLSSDGKEGARNTRSDERTFLIPPAHPRSGSAVCGRGGPSRDRPHSKWLRPFRHSRARRGL